MRPRLLLLVLSLLAFVHARAQPRAEPYVVKIEGDVEYTHDPAIIKDGDTWYL